MSSLEILSQCASKKSVSELINDVKVISKYCYIVRVWTLLVLVCLTCVLLSDCCTWPSSASRLSLSSISVATFSSICRNFSVTMVTHSTNTCITQKLNTMHPTSNKDCRLTINSFGDFLQWLP